MEGLITVLSFYGSGCGNVLFFQSDVMMTASLDLDLDLYIAGAILAIFAMELGEHNANKTCI